ncbi:hypothetical protein NEMBOFW57_009586 [Staphylotrichum longicolle]|uniref:Uncharacterized protein n=1 Tax=Staphylotrichum longicolle TaxID=669026 RepID=A0AAD4EPA2_9PEZI|nr:hypothetical protein NEMBOFW57_009586 [Staphylotrichum longicolle]
MADLTCYNTWGGEDPNQLPCFAPGTVNAGTTTWCCNKNDYCLSNGLCLSPESNNLMTQQGCTDKNWGGACTKFCPATKDQKLTAIPLIPCPASFDNTTNAIKFCCGPDVSTCCESTSSLSWLTLPPGTIIRSSTSTTSSSSSSSSSSTSDANSSYSLKIGLGIGLGIGVPILLVLCAVAYLLATPLRSRHRRHRKNRSGSKQGGGGSGGDSEKASSTTTATTSPPHDSPHSGDRDHKKKKRRRKSFGQVDTSVAPDSDDDDDAAAAAQHYHHHRWPPRGGGAAAVAAWARSPFGFGGMEGPAGAKEMDAGIGTGTGRRGGRPTTTRAPWSWRRRSWWKGMPGTWPGGRGGEGLCVGSPGRRWSCRRRIRRPGRWWGVGEEEGEGC